MKAFEVIYINRMISSHLMGFQMPPPPLPIHLRAFPGCVCSAFIQLSCYIVLFSNPSCTGFYNKRSDFLEFVTVSWNPLRLLNLQPWEAWEGNGATIDKAPRKINGGEQKRQIRVLGDACLQAGQGDENQPISK